MKNKDKKHQNRANPFNQQYRIKTDVFFNNLNFIPENKMKEQEEEETLSTSFEAIKMRQIVGEHLHSQLKIFIKKTLTKKSTKLLKLQVFNSFVNQKNFLIKKLEELDHFQVYP